MALTTATITANGASTQIPKLVYIKYKDHVFFRNVQTLPTESVMREAVGWVKKEDNEIMLIECDRPILQGYSGCNGVVVLKNCIIAMVEVPLNSLFGEHLNCPTAKNKMSAALLAKEAKNSPPQFSTSEDKKH